MFYVHLFLKAMYKKKRRIYFSLPPGGRSVEASESCCITCETENKMLRLVTEISSEEGAR